MPLDADGRYFLPRYRSRLKIIRTCASCVSAIGTLAVLARVFGVL